MLDRLPDSASPALDERLPRQRRLYYGGTWHASAVGHEIAVTCPATGESLGTAIDATV